jgi:endonuclease/exonuclease/phosphatase family metal-dependent hydrolase
MSTAPTALRVMSFNLWHGGDAGRQPLEQSAAVIQAARADIVGLQETHGLTPEFFSSDVPVQAGQTAPALKWPDHPVDRPDNGARLAQMLGWQYFDQGSRRGILTRHKLVSTTPRGWGARIELPSGHQVYMFNAHLAYWPYQPYQVMDIPYDGQPALHTEAQVVQAAVEARGAQVTEMVAELKIALMEGMPTFLTGYFNEPSHLDWTAAAAAAGKCPLKVEYPSTRAVVAAGMRDTYRSLHPDEVHQRGYTWTPLTSPDDPGDIHDRIDFVFMGGMGAVLQSFEIVGEAPEAADIIVTPYPSDHRAVVSSFLVN